MENLKMHTPDLADENFKKLAALFPNAVTETITGYKANGEPIIERAIDADVLRQEISATVVDGPQERYQFTWPDKKSRLYWRISLLQKHCALTVKNRLVKMELQVISTRKISTSKAIIWTH